MKMFPEIEFLDINLIKGLSLLFRAIQIPISRRIWIKTILFSGFKKPLQKILETGKLESVENQTKTLVGE
jgi:hypothetical protein